MLRSLDWLQESDGRWIKGWWDGYQGVKCSDYDEDWLAGFHAGLIAARLDDVGAGELVPNDFYGQRVGERKREEGRISRGALSLPWQEERLIRRPGSGMV